MLQAMVEVSGSMAPGGADDGLDASLGAPPASGSAAPPQAHAAPSARADRPGAAPRPSINLQTAPSISVRTFARIICQRPAASGQRPAA